MDLRQQRIVGHHLTRRKKRQGLLRDFRHSAPAHSRSGNRNTDRNAQVSLACLRLTRDCRQHAVPRLAGWQASRQNLPTLTKPDGAPNYEAAFTSNFYDDMLVGISKLHAVGTILSSPVI